MEDQSYKLILEGKLREGLERPPAIKKLSILLKRDMEEIADLLSGKPRVIAEGLDYRTALKYRSLIGNAGALSRIEPEARVTPSLKQGSRPSLWMRLNKPRQISRMPRRVNGMSVRNAGTSRSARTMCSWFAVIALAAG